MSFNKSQQEKLEKSGYRFVGTYGHAAVKTCHWTRQSIVDNGKVALYRLFAAVFYVAEYGVADACHLHADLMTSARVKGYFG